MDEQSIESIETLLASLPKEWPDSPNAQEYNECAKAYTMLGCLFVYCQLMNIPTDSVKSELARVQQQFVRVKKRVDVSVVERIVKHSIRKSK